MTTLADMPFTELKAGMKFRHPEHGEQIILDLGRNRLGPVIRFHDSRVYNGEMPQLAEGDDANIFQYMAANTYPRGAGDWEYLGEVGAGEVTERGWRWVVSACPHCGHVHTKLVSEDTEEHLRCRGCGWHPTVL
jgi:hypothetical protein